MASVSVDLCGISLENPTILASGVMGSDLASLKRVASSGAGAVTIKSITKQPRMGHKNPTMVEVKSGFLNAVGYSNMGLENALYEFEKIGEVESVKIASVVSETPQGFAVLAQKLVPLGFDAVEAVLSCPHTPGLGLLAGHGTPEATREIAEKVKEVVDVPVIVKLSPNTLALGDVAKAAVEGGADMINMGNTLGPGMVIDTISHKPVLDYKVGGMSGPAIKPITIRCVYDVYEAVGAKAKIIATGGIVSGEDAFEAILAGASAVGVGTGVYYRGLSVFKDIASELIELMESQDIVSVSEIVGAGHG